MKRDSTFSAQLVKRNHASSLDLEKRIGTVFRGAGPQGTKDKQWSSFDEFLLEQAIDKGANLIQARSRRSAWRKVFLR